MGTALFLEEPVSAGCRADTRREAVELRPARLLFRSSIPPDPSLSPHVFEVERSSKCPFLAATQKRILKDFGPRHVPAKSGEGPGGVRMPGGV